MNQLTLLKTDKMIGILSPSNDPAFNLATEEYLLRNTDMDLFYLYVNTPSIIVGKHQNTLAEINFEYTTTHHIPVYRRLSGGGTVYHDLNNLNFCFIQSGTKGQLVNFALYSQPILEALKKLGIEAQFGKRHDIQVDNKKVSGNASHVFKNRVMHHGTLLFNSELDVLNQALKTNPLNFKDKAVKSVRSEVTNLINYTPNLDFKGFTSYIFEFLIRYFDNCPAASLEPEALKSVQKLVVEKFTTREWNYGYSPNYNYKKRIKLSDGQRVNISMDVVKGKITQCDIQSNNNDLKTGLQIIAKDLLEHQHNPVELNAYFDNFKKPGGMPFSKTEWNQLLF